MVLLTRRMSQPSNNWVTDLVVWAKDNTIMFMVFALCWKGIDRAFKYLSESRDERFKEIVREENKILSDKLTEKIDGLTKLFWEHREK